MKDETRALFRELCNQLGPHVQAVEPEVLAWVQSSPATAEATRNALRSAKRDAEQVRRTSKAVAQIFAKASLPPTETREAIIGRIAPHVTRPLDRPVPRDEATGLPITRTIGTDLLPESLIESQGVIGTPFSLGKKGGIPLVEKNKQLVPYRTRGLSTDVGIFTHMSRHDSVIAEGIDSLVSTATIGTWEFGVPDIDPRLAEMAGISIETLQRRADEMNLELVRLSYEFTAVRNAQIRQGLINGFAIHEFGIDATAPVGQRINWLQAREANSVQDWIMTPGGRLAGFIQTDPNGGKRPSVDIRKCLYWARNNDGANWEGVSALRPAWAWDLLLNEFLASSIMHRQRFGAGIPIIRRGPGASRNGDDSSAQAAAALSNYAAIDQAVMELGEGLTVEILQMQAETGLSDIVDMCARMKRAALGSALQDTGQGSGSFALADVKSRMQVAAIESFVQQPGSAWSRLARGLSDVLYGPSVLAPVMRVTGIATRTPAEVIEIHKGFAEVLLTGAYAPGEARKIAERADISWEGTEDSSAETADDVVDEIEEAQGDVEPEPRQRQRESFAPTDAMAEEAERGLAWRAEYGRGGTEVGVARARDIANKRNLSLDTVKRMHAFFSRHESTSKNAEGFRPGEDGYPSAGRIAWALWGGDPGQSFARRIVGQVERAAPHGGGCGCGACDITQRANEPTVRVVGRDGLPFTTYRALRPGEEHIAFRSIANNLDDASEKLSEAVLNQQRLHRNAFVQVARPLIDARDYEQIALTRVPWLDQYATAIEAELAPIAEFASRDMLAELASQVEAKTGSKGWRPSAQGVRDDPAAWARANASLLASKVDDATSERLRNLAMNAAHGGSIQALLSAEGSFGFATTALAAQAVNATLNAAREATAVTLGPAVRATVVEVLDGLTCSACRDSDGETAEVGSEAYERIKPPYYRCASLSRTKGGANECRRVLMYDVIASQIDTSDDEPDIGRVGLFDIDADRLVPRSATLPTPESGAVLVLGPPGAGKSTAIRGIPDARDIDEWVVDAEGGVVRGTGWIDEIEESPPRVMAYTGSSLSKTIRCMAAMRRAHGEVAIRIMDPGDDVLRARVKEREDRGERQPMEESTRAAITAHCRATFEALRALFPGTVDSTDEGG